MEYITQVVFGLKIGNWGSTHFQSIWLFALTYSVVAGIFDLSERRIPNYLTLGALIGVIGIQIVFGNGLLALCGFISVALVLFVPTYQGVWGQGDWKMSFVYGAALGVVPTLSLWGIAYLIAGAGGKSLTRRISEKYMDTKTARSIPVATFMAAATLVCYVGIFISHYV